MGRIIEFSGYHNTDRYREARRALAEVIDEIQARLVTACLNLAASGVWAAWDATQPEGSTVCLDLDDLHRTDDQTLTRAMEIHDELTDLAEELRAGQSSS